MASSQSSPAAKGDLTDFELHLPELDAQTMARLDADASRIFSASVDEFDVYLVSSGGTGRSENFCC